MNVCRNSICLLFLLSFFFLDAEASIDSSDSFTWTRWHRFESLIQHRRDSLERMFEEKEERLTQAYKKDSSYTPRTSFALNLYILGRRISLLDTVLQNLKLLQNSDQAYSIRLITENESGTFYDFKNKRIVFFIVDTVANFIHEITHGVQFERGGLAFLNKTRMKLPPSDTLAGAIGDDYEDERQAYTAEFAYDPKAVSDVPSFSKVRSFDKITIKWIMGLSDTANSRRPYRLAHRTSIALIPVTVDTDLQTLKKAYPLSEVWKTYIGQPGDLPLKDKGKVISKY